MADLRRLWHSGAIETWRARKYSGIEDPAQALDVERTHVGRLWRPTSLSPNLIEAVLRGDEPNGAPVGETL